MSGLNGAFGIAFSADGRFVYVSSVTGGAVVVLRRNTTNGALRLLTVNHAQTFTSPQLVAAYGMALSPDGRQLYVTGYTSDSILVLNRNVEDGTLTQASFIDATSMPGLNGVFRLTASMDGRFLYSASYDGDAVCSLNRDLLTGALSNNGCWINGSSGLTELDATTREALASSCPLSFPAVDGGT